MTSERADEPGLSTWRQALVGALCLVGAIAYGSYIDHAAALLVPTGLLVISAGLVAHRALSSQLLVRAVLWCNLLLGFLMSLDGGSHERPVGCAVALATGAALLVLGRRGLAHSSPRFSPAAYRGSLILALVMALADTQSLALFGVVRWSRSGPASIVLLACAGLMIVALVGLYRLRVWGLVLNIAANLLIAGLALADVLDVPGVVQAALCTTAVIQLLLPVPLLVAMARGRAPEPRTAPHPVWIFAMPALVLAMQGLSLYSQCLPSGLL